MTAVIGETTLARIGAWIEDKVLKDDCEIWSDTPTQLPSGGKQSHWGVAVSCKCATIDVIRPPLEKMIADQESGVLHKIILLPRLTNVQKDNRIVTGGITYHVIDTYEPSSFEVTRRAFVKRSVAP
jgi:hypothetical protein